MPLYLEHLNYQHILTKQNKQKTPIFIDAFNICLRSRQEFELKLKQKIKQITYYYYSNRNHSEKS